MDQHSNRKNKFTLQLITEDETGFIHRRKINSTAVIMAAVLLFLLAVAAVCGLSYNLIALRDAR